MDTQRDSFGFQWHLLDRCNCRCLHCYESPGARSEDPPVEALEAIADALFAGLPDCGVSINLTGGEPFLYAGLGRLARYLSGFEALESFDVISNGTIVDRGALETLGELERARHLKISLESGRAEVHDSIRGAGAFELLEQNVPRLVEHWGSPVVLMVTLGPWNQGDVAQTVEAARRLGAGGIIFERFVPVGRGRDLSTSALSQDSWLEVCASIGTEVGIEEAGSLLSTYRAFWMWLDGREEPLLGASCDLGPSSMALLPDGVVTPCRRLPVEMGRLPDEPFVLIRDRLRDYAQKACGTQSTGACCPATEHARG